MDIDKRVKIVLLETSTETISQIEDFYTKVFQSLKFNCSFNLVDSNPKNFEGKKSVFRNGVVDVFISDLSLGNTGQDNYDGLDLISGLKRRYPDLLIIANSMTNVTHYQTADRIPSFDLFVHKRKMNDERYSKYIVERISKLFKKNIYLHVDFENSVLSNSYSQLPKRIELENLLRSITFSSIKSVERTAVCKVVLKKIEGGMSKSQVYRLFGYTKNGLPTINVILKISRRKDAEIEYHNYLQYVKWYLPYTWRPEVLSSAYWNEIGGICYSHAFNDDVSFNSLTHFIKSKDIDKMNYVIDYIFNPVNQTWYHESNVRERKSITSYYQKKWINGRSNPDIAIRKIIYSIGNTKIKIVNHDLMEINNEKYTNPGVDLLGKLRGSFLTCICHGDLSSNNILISENHVTFIDFQDTGIGHIFEDFVSIELSLRLYYKLDMEFLELLLEERSLIRNTLITINDNANPKFNISDPIRRIRKRAFSNFFPQNNNGKKHIRNYLYALAISAYGMLRKPYLEIWQKHQLLALTLAANKELSLLE